MGADIESGPKVSSEEVGLPEVIEKEGPFGCAVTDSTTCLPFSLRHSNKRC